MPPTSIFLAETLIGAALAVPIFLINLYKQNAQPQTFNAFGLLSGAVLALGLLFYYLALEESRVAMVVPLTATYPVVSALLGYALLGERPSPLQWVGIILVVAGAALLLSGPMKVTQR